MCGEKPLQLTQHCRRLGSPPRVRGKVLLGASAILSMGITPACAGKRTMLVGAGMLFKDHPRVCGEKFSAAL